MMISCRCPSMGFQCRCDKYSTLVYKTSLLVGRCKREAHGSGAKYSTDLEAKLWNIRVRNMIEQNKSHIRVSWKCSTKVCAMQWANGRSDGLGGATDRRPMGRGKEHLKTRKS